MPTRVEPGKQSSTPKKDESKRDDIPDLPDSILSQTLFP